MRACVDYAKPRQRWGLASYGTDLLVLAALALTGPGRAVVRGVAGLAGAWAPGRVVLATLAVLAVRAGVGLPFSIRAFRQDARAGLATQGLGGFLRDWAKGRAVGLVLTVLPLAALVLGARWQPARLAPGGGGRGRPPGPGPVGGRAGADRAAVQPVQPARPGPPAGPAAGAGRDHAGAGGRRARGRRQPPHDQGQRLCLGARPDPPGGRLRHPAGRRQPPSHPDGSSQRVGRGHPGRGPRAGPRPPPRRALGDHRGRRPGRGVGAGRHRPVRPRPGPAGARGDRAGGPPGRARPAAPGRRWAAWRRRRWPARSAAGPRPGPTGWPWR